MGASVYFSLHAHFYQPPRENPFAGVILPEHGAEPYANWNERISAECYAPNAVAGNFEWLSFNLGGTLANWLARYQPEVYARIVASDRLALQTTGQGNALVQPTHHTILPLARLQEKRFQIAWGLASFEARFGRRPHGMWLPECAVDQETLECVAEAGLSFVVLSEEQLQGLPVRNHAGPYKVRLSGGRTLGVYARDRLLSNQISFDMERIAASAHPAQWLAQELARRAGPRGSRLVLVATDGETFGHHHRSGIEFLQALRAVGDMGLPVQHTSLAAHFHEHAPRYEVVLVEPSAWSCEHGLARWVTGCACTPGDSRWKGALRRALDNLANTLDQAYRDEVRALDATLDPWLLLEGYSQVILRLTDGPHYLLTRGLNALTAAQSARLLALLQAQYHRQRMYTSCAFFFEDLLRPEPQIALVNAAMAVYLVRWALGVDLSGALRHDLRHAISARTRVTAAELYDGLAADGAARVKGGH